MMDTKDRILGRALAVLAGEQATEFTMKKLAEDLGLSSGSVFHAFPTRDSLVAAAFAEGIGLYHAAAIQAMAHDDPLVALRRFVESHLQWVEANAGLARFLFTSQPSETAAEASELASTTNELFADAQSHLYAALSAAGTVAVVDDRVAHSLAIGPSQEYCRKWLRGTASTAPSVLASSFSAAATAALASTLQRPQPPASSESVEPVGPPPGTPVLTYRGAIYPWHCDHMGHMNVMWYSSKFDEATWHFFGGLGLTPARLRDEDRGMVAIDQRTKYLAELVAGDLVEITTRMLDQHDKVLTFEHEMVNSVTGEVAATSRLTGIHLDTKARRPRSLPEDVKQAVRLSLRHQLHR